MSNFYICLVFVAVFQVALLVIHPIFMTQLKSTAAEIYMAVERPSISYFASGSAFSFGPFAGWLLSFRAVSHSGLTAKLKVLATLESVLFVLLIMSWFFALVVWVADR